ncbi:Uncharacterized protein dnm_008420 [Desulfonema magnum]|uniref:Uncharacterized protein n=1 Tax=Desulfonema magnum TaxID=45655 RepID=A0A975BG76_9BACT|nr:Uncharacterized protein dnm_008420 [Desulfonema magnum]
MRKFCLLPHGVCNPFRQKPGPVKKKDLQKNIFLYEKGVRC